MSQFDKDDVVRLIRIASYGCWFGAGVSLIVYNFFIDFEGIHRSPCILGQVEMVFRSATYCGSAQQANLWTENNIALATLLVFALTLTVVSGLLRRYSEWPRTD